MVSVTIDLGALRSNLKVIRRLAPKSRVMAVIKANAYGHGLIAVARALESADALAVARLGEALNLREAGIRAPILLLEGVLDREQLDAAAAAELELIVHCAEQLEFLKAAPAGARFKVWLKLDSGMNRLGFKGDDFQAAHAALGRSALRAAAFQSLHASVFRRFARVADDGGAIDGVRGGHALAGRRAKPGELGGDPRLSRFASRLGETRRGAIWHLALQGLRPARITVCGR